MRRAAIAGAPRAASAALLLAVAVAVALVLAVACDLTDGLQGGGPLDDDGGDAAACDADLLRSPTSCGACGNACPSGPGSVPACFDGGCALVCLGSTGDCDKDPTNGCEVNLLTSRVHCARCGHDCLGGACVNGACQPYLLASGSDAPASIVVDSQYVYGVNAFGTVSRVAKDGGPTGLVPLVAGTTAQTPPCRIAQANGVLYWTSMTDGRAGPDGGVYDFVLDGGKEAGVAASADAPLAIVATPGALYWSEDAAVKTCKLPACASSVQAVAAPETGSIVAMSLQAGALYWTNAGTPPAYADGAVKKCPLGALPCAAQTLASTPPRPFGLVVDNGAAFWTSTNGSIASCFTQGCSNEPAILDSFQYDPGFLAQSGAFLFFTSRDGTLKSVSKTGPASSERTLYQQRASFLWDVVAEPDAVYFTDLAPVAGTPGAPGPALFKLAR